MQTSKYKQMNLQVYGHQVSGKTSKFTDKSQKFIYKPYSLSQGTFYQHLQYHQFSHNSYQLSKFIPHYHGIFTLSEILHHEDNILSHHEHSNLPGQKLTPVKQITKEQLPYIETSPQRKEWIEHINSRTQYEDNQKFIKLKNLTYGYKYPNIVDLKLGVKKEKKESNERKNKSTTTSSHGFRVNGMSVRQLFREGLTLSDKQGQFGIEAQEIFMSKYYCQKITQLELNKHLGFFFFDGLKVDIKLLDKIIQSLKELILGFMCYRGIIFESSSLYIAYDAYDHSKYTINFIDFDKYHEGEGIDLSVERGLKSCLRHLIELKEGVNQILRQLIYKEIMYYDSEHEVVPKDKQQQYEQKKKNSPKRCQTLD